MEKKIAQFEFEGCNNLKKKKSWDWGNKSLEKQVLLRRNICHLKLINAA